MVFRAIMNAKKLLHSKKKRKDIKKIFLINDWSAILLCLPCIIFHEYMCGFCCLWNFGVLLRDLAVVMKFGCHIDRIISL